MRRCQVALVVLIVLGFSSTGLAQPPPETIRMLEDQAAYDEYYAQYEAHLEQLRARSVALRFQGYLVSLVLVAGAVVLWTWHRSARRHQQRVLGLVERELAQTDRMVELLESINARLTPPAA